MNEINKLYCLTNPQKSIWMIEQFYPNSNINSMGGSIKIFEKVNFELLIKAYNLLLQKNDGMRIRIVEKDGTPYQYISDFVPETVEIIDIKREEFDKKMKEYVPKSFKIIDSKLYSFEVYRFENGEGAYVAYLHHLICDAWTTSLFVNEIMSLYSALKKNLSTDDIIFPSYLKFIESENKYLSSERFKLDREYWENEFNTSFDLTTFKSEKKYSNTNFARKTFKLPSELLSKMENFVDKNSSSIPAFLLSIYSLYINKILDKDKVVIGTPVLNRSSFSEKNTFGTFISTVPVLINYNAEEDFLERTKELTKNQKMMYRHLKYPYQEIAKYVKDKHDYQDKLYDIVFSYQNARSNVNSLDMPFEITWIPSTHQLESLMIHVTDTNDSGVISIHYDYQTDIFTEDDIICMHERIERIMYQILSSPKMKCKDIEIISLKEKNTLLRDFNNTDCLYNKYATIISEFEKGVLAHPDIIALTFENKSYTYKELNNLANQLATELLDNGVMPNNIVGIFLPRSAELIISILAILKVGATYMPIDPEYPAIRINYMIENSQATIIITNNSLKGKISHDVNALLINSVKFDKNKNTENLDINYSSDSLAYIMYTSGTTGIPKAVMIRNYSVINFAESMRRRLDYSSSSDNVVLSVTTICFDIFVFEVFPTLLYGLHLVVANEEEQKNPLLLSRLIENQNICKILTTPSRIQLLFLNSNFLKCLQRIKEIILGGEPFPVNFISELPKLTTAKIYNLYGPTETTVYSTFKDLTHEREITIGKPIENTTIYILDKSKKLLPIGSIGDIYIGGLGVAKGYYRNEQLTNEKFVKNPYNESEIIYNTGDLGKWLPNGELLCLGRTDNQVKIRGYRIELGDIETHIASYPDITKAVVTDKETTDGKKYLCAYYISDKDISIKDLHQYLLSKLPNYMVPLSYVKMDAFPLTSNHKIDRKSLPTPQNLFNNKVEDYVAPSTKNEKILCDIIAKVLGVEKIGINDDIFDYSADSLTIIQMQTLLIPYNFNFKTQDFYQLRTIKAFAEHIENKHNTSQVNLEDDKYLYDLNNLILKHNKDTEIKNKVCKKGYLLTGSTGYLGIHLLHELLSCTNSDIYCIVRKKKNIDINTRISDLWNYYFANENVDYSRVHIIEGDITKQNFGLKPDVICQLAESVSCIFNCAANVKYYGDYENHEIINVKAVKNIIDFCLKYSIHLNQISTTGVSGNYLVSHTAPNRLFTENDFYIGQNYKENVYIHSKFEAEKMIYESKEKGLNYNIFRVGNLTSRFSDGKFQHNKDENAFYNILKFISSNKIIPNEMMKQNLEFTPVDLCARAIVMLSKLDNLDERVFHVYNEHFLSMQKLIEILNKFNIHVEILSTIAFNDNIAKLSNDPNAKNSLKAIINDLDSNSGLSFSPSVVLNNEITNNYLNKLGFTWPEINLDYVEKIIKIL